VKPSIPLRLAFVTGGNANWSSRKLFSAGLSLLGQLLASRSIRLIAYALVDATEQGNLTNGIGSARKLPQQHKAR